MCDWYSYHTPLRLFGHLKGGGAAADSPGNRQSSRRSKNTVFDPVKRDRAT
jgi:hypothetical protein